MAALTITRSQVLPELVETVGIVRKHPDEVETEFVPADGVGKFDSVGNFKVKVSNRQ